MHFRILKMISTSDFLTALECTKFVFGVSASDLTGGAYSATADPLAGLGGPTSTGRGEKEGKGLEKGVEERGKRRGGRGMEEKGMGGKESRNTLSINSCLRPWPSNRHPLILQNYGYDAIASRGVFVSAYVPAFTGANCAYQ